MEDSARQDDSGSDDNKTAPKRTIVARFGVAAGLIFIIFGVLGLLADPLGIPDDVWEILDKRASVISMLLGLVGLIIALLDKNDSPRKNVDEEFPDPESIPTLRREANIRSAVPTYRAPSQKIMLVGPPGSGKTCYLAVLDLAIGRSGEQWSFIGRTNSSTRLSIKLAMDILNRRFPQASTSMEEYGWDLGILVRRRRKASSWFRRKKFRLVVGIDVTDVPGGQYDEPRNSFDEAPQSEVLTRLAECDGIILFIDPIAEFERPGCTAGHFLGWVMELERAAYQAGHLHDIRLHHHLAVCIVKLDDPLVFGPALDNSLVDIPEDGRTPVPTESQAAEMFEDLCKRSPEMSTLKERIRRYFHTDRTRFYAISSIGFHVGEDGFSEDDYQNILPVADNTTRIRSSVNPINVLEPLRWVATNVLRSDKP
ncbi:hypothetical protein [Herbidospora sp. RD11066]